MYKMEQEIPIPEELNRAVEAGMNGVRKIHRRRMRKRVNGTVAGIFFLGAVFLMWGFSNPVLASQIPFVGRIFAELQHEVEFSGDFEEKAVALEEASETEEQEKYCYTVSDKGYEFTIREVYCDGLALYLGMTVKKEGGFGKITEGAQGLPAIILYDIHVQPEGGETIYEQGIPWLEGRQTADGAFEGIIRVGLDKLEETLSANCDMKVGFSWFLYYEENPSENGEAALEKYNERGDWQMYLPVSVDTEHVKKYAICDTAQGYGIENVVVTPYEICVEALFPSRYETEEAYYEAVREFLRESYSEQQDYTLEDITAMTPEELDEIAWVTKFGDYGVALFDQNGERIECSDSSEEKSYGMDFIYPVEEREITELHIYVGENVIDCMKETNEQAMKERALYETVVQLSE